MAQQIHPTAIIESGAELASDVVIGAYAYVGNKAIIGAGTILHHHGNVEGRTTIGRECEIFPFACVGTKTHDLKYKGGEPGLMVVNFMSDDRSLKRFVGRIGEHSGSVVLQHSGTYANNTASSTAPKTARNKLSVKVPMYMRCNPLRANALSWYSRLASNTARALFTNTGGNFLTTCNTRPWPSMYFVAVKRLPSLSYSLK